MHLRGENFRMQPLVLFELFPPWWPWLRAYVFRKGALYLDSAGGGTGVGFLRPPVCNPLKLSASQRGYLLRSSARKDYFMSQSQKGSLKLTLSFKLEAR